MEKKEPTLSPATEPNRAQATQPNRLPEAIKRDRFGRFCKDKKSVAIALGAIIVIAGLCFLVSSILKNDKPNEVNVADSSVKAVPDTIAPSFDVVRMENGEIVVSGRAAPKDVVHILDNEREIGTETADENGQWVFLPKKALPVGDRKLSLFVIAADGTKIRSKQSALLHVSKKPGEEVGVVMGGKNASRVIKAPKGQNIGALRVEKIDYAEDGAFKASGFVLKNSKVNLYIEGVLLASADSDETGAWSVDKEYKLEAGKKYSVRADMLGANGKVAKRVVYKFAPAFIDEKNTAVVIKRGDNLWNIALKEYGRGADYVVIFEANRSQIADPDKIYERQAFTLPSKSSAKYGDLKKNGRAGAKAVKESKKK
ncbi:MAG: hypothetical protein LBL52_04210 [Rickettsiales bacterium]|jgi:nucleoid-associated protein YgaU|nr:hypothetical protein [Rickettsiales bacterium]